jgi:predicted Zn finger-like uncharacterized protein
MIVTCPACATRYRVAEQEFENSSGRTVRCANCGYVWHEKVAVHPPTATLAASDRGASGAELADQVSPAKAAPTVSPSLEIPPNSRSTQPRTRSFASVGAMAVVLILAIAVAWILARGYFAENPAPASASKALSDGSAAAARSATGLIIRKVTPARTADGLVVDGEIVNPGTVPRDVPRLNVALQDKADKVVRSETVDPPKHRLEPGEIVHFETPFARPPDAATGVVVTFASS